MITEGSTSGGTSIFFLFELPAAGGVECADEAAPESTSTLSIVPDGIFLVLPPLPPPPILDPGSLQSTRSVVEHPPTSPSTTNPPALPILPDVPSGVSDRDEWVLGEAAAEVGGGGDDTGGRLLSAADMGSGDEGEGCGEFEEEGENGVDERAGSEEGSE